MKNKFTYFAFFMLIAIATEAQSFKLFHQVRYNNTPSNLSPYLSPFKISNESVLLNASDSTPNQAAIQSFALTCPAGVPVCLDLETWPYYPNAKLTSTINKFLTTIDYFKAVNMVSPIGFYGVAPKQAYEWSSIDPVNNPGGYAFWKRISDSFARVAVKIDVFQPSFYAYESDTTSWRKMVDTTMAATKRYSKTKPVYAWIWPQYHQSARPNQLEFIDTAIWRYQLETLYKRTDGVIIWTSNKMPDGTTIYWDPNMLWWQVTKSFMVQKSLSLPFVLDSFHVKRTGNNENVTWSTSVDTTTYKFLVERSTDEITFVDASDSIAPASTYYTQNSYQFNDNASGSNLYYRLKIIHKDGSISYSSISNAFSAGILAVLRIGGVNGTNGTPGSSTPGTGGSPIHIDKYAVSAGAFTYISSIDLPARSLSNEDTIFASSSPNEGYLIQSANKQYLSVMGYAAKSASGTIYSTTNNPNLARTLGLIKYDGTVNISTKLSNFPASGAAATAQSSITNDGTNLWASTNQGVSPMGVLYTTPGALDATAAPTVIATTATGVLTSVRSLSIFGGDLYYAAGAGNRIGTVSATGGLPTTAGASNMTGLQVASGSTSFGAYSPSQIVMFDLDPSVLGYDVMYVTNTTTNADLSGVYKYCKNDAGKWVSFGSFGTTSSDGVYFGITGEVIDGLPMLYVTRGISATQNLTTNQLLQIEETSGYNVNMNAIIAATTNAGISGMSGTIRGVAFYPSASFYYKGTGDLNDVANWGSDVEGTGTAPTNFTGDEQTFFINNGASASLSADFTVSGLNSKIVLGDGINATTLTIPPTFSISAEMDVYNNATLNIQNTQAPQLHFVAKNSTINFAAAASQNVKTMAYGNFSNNNNNSATINGIVTVAGDLVQNGLLKGNATVIAANGFTNSGALAPGNSPGLFTVTGNFTNAASGDLAIELGNIGTAGIDYDLLAVSGNATMGGTLNIAAVNGFELAAGQTFTIVTAAAVAGTFATVNWPAGVTGNVVYTATTVEITVTSVALPLNLISFSGSVLQNGKNQLQWKTANEDNVDYFSIERSENGTNFSFLDKKLAVGTGNHVYEQIDVTPFAGYNYYRLKIVDKDGKFVYSNIIRLKNNASTNFSIFPNPAKSNLIVTHPVGSERSFISLLQADGKLLLKQKITSGALQTSLNISRLIPGVYIITVNAGKVTNSYKLIKE